MSNSNIIRNARPFLGSLAVGLTTLSVSATAMAQRPDELVRRANESLAAGDADAALADYAQAAESASDQQELVYNQAVAHYRKGDLAAARALFGRATSADDRQLESRARYNLGNCDYSEAVQLAEQDRPTAISKLETAVAHYRSSLSANRHDADARANIELARMLMDRLKQEEQQDQQQEQDQQNKDGEQNEEGEEQDQQQKDSDSKDEPKNEEQQSSDGEGEDEQDEKNDNKQGKGDKPSEEEPSQDESQQPEDQQGEPQDDDQPQDGEQSENKDQQEAGAHQPQSGQPGYTEAVEGEPRPMTKEEAAKMLQAVRDRDLKRRIEKLRAIEHSRPIVDRDW